MLFKDLYQIVDAEIADPPVRFEFLRDVINTRHKPVGEIVVRAISYPVPNHQAHYVLKGSDRTSAYEDEFEIAEIRYCDALDKHPFERRYALTKELMHVFDSDDEKANTREKFITLLREIQNQPLSSHASKIFESELSTRWMAAILLFPKKFRDTYIAEYKKNKIADFELSELMKIPEWVIPFIMDDYYDRAFSELVDQV